jgi:hypothetical protein
MARPKSGENPLVDYAETARSSAMRAVLRMAIRHGLNVTRLARLADCDRKSLADFVDATRFTNALGLPPVVGRALLDALDDRDARLTYISVDSALAQSDERVRDERESFAEAWSVLSGSQQRSVAAAYLLAREGLLEATAGPLAAVEAAMHGFGHDLEIAERVESREAAVAFTWLAEAASLTPFDQERIWEQIRPRVGAEHPSEIEPRAKHLLPALREILHKQRGSKP